VSVSYLDPLRSAWARAQRMLFRPFQLTTWLVLGFAAFLSEFGTRGGYGTGRGGHRDHLPWPGGSDLSGMLSGMLHAGIVAVLIGAAVMLIVLFTWINSRGRFVFLDNVVHERAAIVEPWKRHAALANSLFAWMLGFEVACVVVVALMALPFLAVLSHIWSGGHFRWELLGAVWVLLAMALPFALAAVLVLFALGDFVVPIMYRQQIGVLAAWSRFLALVRAQPGAFVLYALFVFVVSTLIAAALWTVGIMTCCIGLVLFSMPYVSSVVLLPVHVTFRALGPEFLAQFGPDYALLAPVSPAPGGAAPPPAAPGGGGR
jgi:hypothetical protein